MDTTVFIGLVIAGVTEAIRLSVPKVNGSVTIVVAALVGFLIALVDKPIGLPNITIVAGITAGLATAGVVGIAKRFG